MLCVCIGSGQQCLVVGNPCPLALGRHVQFEELPNAEKEARCVAAMLRATGRLVTELSTQQVSRSLLTLIGLF
jgi:hypothetical protein